MNNEELPRITDLLKELEALNRYLREKGLGQGEIDSISSLYDEIDALKDADTKLKLAREALKDFINAYIRTLENARERIIFFGGTCDSLEKMQEGDICLRAAKQALEKIGK